MKFWMMIICAVGLSACAGAQPGPQLITYNVAQAKLVAGSDGYYTFGSTRYKGPLLGGAPNGAGLCIDGAKGTGPGKPCTYDKGNRTDKAYVQAKAAIINEERQDELRSRREEEQARAEWRAQQRADERASERAMQQAILGSVATMQQNTARLAAIDRQVAAQKAQLQQEQRNAALARQASERLQQAQAAASKANTQIKAPIKASSVAEPKAVVASRANQELLAKQGAEAAAAKQEAEATAAKRAQDKEQKAKELAAAKEAVVVAKKGYLTKMAAGTKLYARNCPSGDGNYFLVGLLPKIKPELVSCVDVHYEAICEGSSQGSKGVATNFVGAATDCFMGDAVAILPKPSCPIKQVNVRVVDIRKCGE